MWFQIQDVSNPMIIGDHRFKRKTSQFSNRIIGKQDVHLLKCKWIHIDFSYFKTVPRFNYQSKNEKFSSLDHFQHLSSDCLDDRHISSSPTHFSDQLYRKVIFQNSFSFKYVAIVSQPDLLPTEFFQVNA